MTTNEWLFLLDLMAVAAIVVLTIHLMQGVFVKSHIALRLALVVVCVGAVFDMYCSVTHPHMWYGSDPLNATLSDLGHAAVYWWAAAHGKVLHGVFDERQMDHS